MTEEQKDILIAKMLDAPASLSDEELDMIFRDEELKEIYNASALVSVALMPQEVFDAEQEWRLFRHRILPKPSLTRRFMRVAAIFLGVMLVSGIIAKLIDYSLTRGGQEQMAEVTKATLFKDQENKSDANDIPHVEPLLTPTETQPSQAPIMTTLAKKAFQASLKEEEKEIDVEEYLRRQQEEIEDAIIRQNAEIYVDEYYAMKEFISGMNDENIIITE